MQTISRAFFDKKFKKKIIRYHEGRAKKEKQKLLNEIKEKIQKWKDEGYDVEELENEIEPYK